MLGMIEEKPVITGEEAQKIRESLAKKGLTFEKGKSDKASKIYPNIQWDEETLKTMK